jgi:gamma-D-glutamyl-L-lysine dipeptidyl-peptidase
MTKGIVSLPLVPLRSEPSDRSEMTTQLLFGELFDVLEEGENWSRIRNLADGYEGWCTTKMLTPIPDIEWEGLQQIQPDIINIPLAPCRKEASPVLEMSLPAGSKIYDLNEHHFTVYERAVSGVAASSWVLERSLLDQDPNLPLSDKFIQTAFCFLNAPYLWGGKSILGIDCSGLTQLSASIHGVSLPRDASDQVLQGDEVFLMSALPGDLAFFTNAEGQVVHVGMVLADGKILHASGSVHVDTLDESGIYSEMLGRYTHKLYVVKRIFPNLSE